MQPNHQKRNDNIKIGEIGLVCIDENTEKNGVKKEAEDQCHQASIMQYPAA